MTAGHIGFSSSESQARGASLSALGIGVGSEGAEQAVLAEILPFFIPPHPVPSSLCLLALILAGFIWQPLKV